ncbi:hypothetical protein Scep_008339 [Stephania cephalantha]|uniref:Exostosin GT47 domain-containing protein n=1 Tax=Stephania cephalantha TaxID=152367 RepID=A0AAP0KE55_9MAGN
MERLRAIPVLIASLIFSLLILFFFCDSPAISGFYSTKLGLQFSKLDLVRTNEFFMRSYSAAVLENSTRINNSATAVQRKYGQMRDVEVGLARARAAIRRLKKLNGSKISLLDNEDAPRGQVYRNPSAFYQSYVEMEKSFKVYVYEEGEAPIVHFGPCKNIYTSEGRFISEMEIMSGGFRTRDPERAHVYFMPFSVTMMVEMLWRQSRDMGVLRRFVWDYVRSISTKYPYWNRTQGSDHFMLTCHDWGPISSMGEPFLYNNSIRVLCNANSSEGFNPNKDATLPEIFLYDGTMPSDLVNIPDPETPRPHLGFFAGGSHGWIRPVLFDHWKNRDPDLIVSDYLPKGQSYYYPMMLKSKFCLCPSGYEVASPRLTEAIYAECVPVIISNHYVLPFSDVLRWEEFSVRVDPVDIPKLKDILIAIPEEEYVRLKKGVRTVRRHFVLNQPLKRFDVFHMILHSVWLRRLNVRLP